MKLFNEDPNIDKNGSIELLQDKEKTWESAFGNEYKPDFSYKKFFLNIKSKKDNQNPQQFDDEDRKIFGELFCLLKNNGFKLNIPFLESLNDNLKQYLSSLFLSEVHLTSGRKIGKSLFIRFCRWNHPEKQINSREIEQISANFDGFNLKYFKQAYRYFINQVGDLDILHIISEYNLIKNIDNDIKLPEITKLKLGENYSLGAFHAQSEVHGFGREETWGVKEFDENGKETYFGSGKKTVSDGRLDYNILDRNHPSTYRIASGIAYQEYLDSPTGIALFYKNKPIAVISFYIKDGNELFINQIQKVPHYEFDRWGRTTGKYYSSATNGIDWKNTLYSVAKSLAKKYNLARIIIQGGENNKRTKELYEEDATVYFKKKFGETIPQKNTGKVHLDPDIAKEIYDNFAKKHGFNPDSDGNWEMEI